MIAAKQGLPPAACGGSPALSLAGIGMGANQGPKAATLLAAWQELGAIPAIQPLALSSPWRSRPLDMQSANEFVNAVALIGSGLNPSDLLQLLLTLEARHGRRRDPGARGHQDRPLDLDLLFFGGLCRQTATLTLPHPRLAERLFVLAPLAEILPDWQHPLLRQSALELLERLEGAGQQVQKDRWPDPAP